MASQELLGLMAALAGVSAAAFAAVNRVVPRPYMVRLPMIQEKRIPGKVLELPFTASASV